MSAKVVARLLNGTVIKGTSLDVNPDRPFCHIRGADDVNHLVALADLKALFFVKDFTGNAAHRDSNAIDPSDARMRGAKKIQIRFADGETLAGITHHFPPSRPFFFVVPADADTNNIRILVNRGAVAEFRALEAA